jgi:hypothetical protein
MVDENAAGLMGTAITRQGEIQRQLLVQPLRVAFIADQQKTRVVRSRFGGHRFERDLRTDSRHVAE